MHGCCRNPNLTYQSEMPQARLERIQGPNGQPGYVWLTSDPSNGRMPVHEIRADVIGSLLRSYCGTTLAATSQ